jgi:hypothetical protein
MNSPIIENNAGQRKMAAKTMLKHWITLSFSFINNLIIIGAKKNAFPISTIEVATAPACKKGAAKKKPSATSTEIIELHSSNGYLIDPKKMFSIFISMLIFKLFVYIISNKLQKVKPKRY